MLIGQDRTILVKIQEVSVPVTGGHGSLRQCVCGKSAANKPFFRVRPSSHSNPKISSSMSNIDSDITVLDREEAGSADRGASPYKYK